MAHHSLTSSTVPGDDTNDNDRTWFDFNTSVFYINYDLLEHNGFSSGFYRQTLFLIDCIRGLDDRKVKNLALDVSSVIDQSDAANFDEDLLLEDPETS